VNRHRLWLIAAAIAMSYGSAAQSATYDWSMTVTADGDGFSLPSSMSYIGQVIGSGHLYTENTFRTDVVDQYLADYGSLPPLQTYTVTGIDGTLAGVAISGLAVPPITGAGNFTPDVGYTPQNVLQVVHGLGSDGTGTGFVLGGDGSLIVQLAGGAKVDGGYQLALAADNFYFGATLDTVNGNEWQGDLTLTPDPSSVSGQGTPASAPEPAAWMTLLVGLGSVGTALRRRSKSALTTV
jgi:hypothetical protein